MPLQRQKVEVSADFHQFYLWDRGMTSTSSEEYTDEDVLRRIKTGPNVVVIQPACRPEEWDHVVEASLDLPTGQLEVHECTGGAVADFQVRPGWYRVRAMQGGLTLIDGNGLDGEDYYKVVLWPAAPGDIVVIKQWSPVTAA